MVITTKKHCLSEAREEMMLRKMLPSAENAKCVEIRAHFVSSFLVLHGRKKPSCVKISRLPMLVFFASLSTIYFKA